MLHVPNSFGPSQICHVQILHIVQCLLESRQGPHYTELFIFPNSANPYRDGNRRVIL